MSARKFKIGDKVKVVKSVSINCGNPHGVKIGRKANVIDIEPKTDYPYELGFRGKQPKYTWFNARELELVERKQK